MPRSYAEYRRLAAEQAALRRLATLVARGVEPWEVFDAVTKEMCRCVRAEGAGLYRYETSDEITMVAATYHPAAEPVQVASGHANTDRGQHPRIDGASAAAGPLGWTATRTSPGPSRHRCVRWASALRWASRSSSMDACGAWRRSVRHEPGPMPADTEARISGFAELVASVVVAGYRDEQKRQLLGDTSQRPFLIDSLLEGRAIDRWSLCEVASHLRLPANGPFVVIAAEVPAVGIEALPEVESKLRGRDVYSAWRLQPDLQVGIVHVKSERQLDEILGLVSRLATNRVGVSARFDDLRDTPQALHFAKVMLRGRADEASSVAVFDGSILATAAVSAPDVMVKSIGKALDGFDDLTDAEREMLFETFRVWQDNDASVRSVAEVLICHPNTVRHRLRRIEKRTGRSLSRPKDVAELCLAFEVHRRLM